MTGQFSIVVVFCVIVGCLARPPPTFLEYKDTLGQYSFGYSAPGSARSEVRSADGSTRGSYSYVDGSGIIQSAQYTADVENGFQVVATNLPRAPVSVEYTPEVAAARLDHFKALEAAAKLAEQNPEIEGGKVAGDVIDGKSDDVVAIENAPEFNENMLRRVDQKNAKSEIMADTSAMEQEGIKIDGAKENISKDKEIEMLEGAMQMKARAGTLGSNENILQSQSRAALNVPSPNVPVVTSSFVIPGTLNLHSKTQLDPSASQPASRMPVVVSLPWSAAQPLIPQGQGPIEDPSLITPAGTKMMALTRTSDKIAMPMSEMSPEPMQSTMMSSSGTKSQESPATFIPGVIAPINAYSLSYGVGINPIYRQYNPYRYFTYIF